MSRVLDFIARVAPTDATVLLHGESGTGKELAACAIHRASHRASGPFVAINCAALPEHLIESELFGHSRGAFTGAVTGKKGKMEFAAGGTLFLDEIGELPIALQPKLLRALQEREFTCVGANHPIQADVRIVAATNCDLRAAITKGTFRLDLFFRLDVVSMTLPPLRDRREDIPLLAKHFASECGARLGRHVAGFSAEALQRMLGYSWPGNIRELQNAVERAVVLGSGDVIQLHDLPEAIVTARPATAEEDEGSFHTAVRQFKRHLILKAVDCAGGNITHAARTLSVDPNYLHRLLRNLNLREGLK
ncbi:MAG: sigma-54-dependent Fis family transcriptional regulator [Acidobacteria bacterium]|nr:sigma-54-dependent Fis family transcriptional regulator [Acidobacteriota bacterium]